MIISILNKNSGFFSQFFFTLNHYIYCNKNNINFKINSDEWLFKYINGWTDYFKDISLFFNEDIKDINYYGHCQITDNYMIHEYKNIINDVYIYNEDILNKINEFKNKLDLKNNEYDGIFIRRGDKLISESIYINACEYLKILLLKNSNAKKIFLQTDDYNCYLEINQYINNNNLNIELLTLCKENLKGGMVIFGFNQNSIINNNIKNIENINYVNSNDNLKINYSVDKMNNLEIYHHTIDMIVGIDLVLKSNICVTDYSSNVARFIKLAHNNSNNVFNINDIDNDIDYNKYLCPSYGF